MRVELTKCRIWTYRLNRLSFPPFNLRTFKFSIYIISKILRIFNLFFRGWGNLQASPRPILLYNEFGCLTSSQGNQTPQDCSSTFLRRNVAPEFANNKINSLINDTLVPMNAGGTFIQPFHTLIGAAGGVCAHDRGFADRCLNFLATAAFLIFYIYYNKNFLFFQIGDLCLDKNNSYFFLSLFLVARII